MKYNIYLKLLFFMILVTYGCNKQQATEPDIRQQSENNFLSKQEIPYPLPQPPLDTLIIITDLLPIEPSCAGEVLEYSSGALHFLLTKNLDNLGREHSTLHIDAVNISAVGQSGAMYRITGSGNTSFQDVIAESLVNTSLSNFTLIGKGVSSDLTLEVSYTEDEDGELVIHNVNFSCL